MLPGVHRVRSKLASGQVAVYWYAWRGGPRLPGKPGTPDFMAAYNAAVAKRPSQPAIASLSGLIRSYEGSTEFPKNESTAKDYKR